MNSESNNTFTGSNVLKADFGGRGGGGSTIPPMEARVAKLETAVEYIQRDISELKDEVRGMRGDIASIRTTDFRILFGAIITVALGLAALMAKGFHWL